MKKNILLEFINKHTSDINQARWISSAKNKTLRVSMQSSSKTFLCEVTLSNWDGFEDAELGISDLYKFKRELTGIVGEDITFVINHNDDKTQIISLDVMDGESVGTFVLSDLDVLPASSNIKKQPPYNVEIIIDNDFKERFLKAKSALPDADYFTIMMNKKGVLELVIGYSSINSSRFSLKVKTNPGKDKVANPLSFGADYLKNILSVNTECGDSVLKVSDNGLCNVEFKAGDFDCKYYLTSVDSQD